MFTVHQVSASRMTGSSFDLKYTNLIHHMNGISTNDNVDNKNVLSSNRFIVLVIVLA